MGRDRTNWPTQDPVGKTRRRRDRRKVDRLPEDQACPIRVGSLMSSASVSYAPPARYEYVPNTTRPAPHILDSDFSEYEEDRDLYDQLPEYDSDYCDYESARPIFQSSQFVSPPRVSSTRATSPCRSKYTNLYEGTRLAIYPGPPRGGQRRRPGRALPYASRCAATKTQSSHSSPATAKPADPQMVAKLPAQREEEPPNHEAFYREIRAEIEGQGVELAALTAQVRQGWANQPSYSDVATATDSLLMQVHVAVETDPPPCQAHAAVGTDSPPCQAHVAVGTDSPPRQAHVAVETDPPPRHSLVEVLAVPSRVHAAVGTDPLPRHAHVSVSTDSLPTLVHVALETDSPPRHAHVAVSTDALQAHVAVGTDPMPPHVAVQEVATSPQPLLVRALEYQWRPSRGRSTLLLCRRPSRGRSTLLLCRRPSRGRSTLLLCRRRARPYVPVQEVATVTLTLPSHVAVQEGARVSPPSHVAVQEGAMVSTPSHVAVQEGAMVSPPSHVAVQEGAMVSPPSHVAVQEGAMVSPPSHVAVQEEAMVSPPSHVAVQEEVMVSPPSHVAVQEEAMVPSSGHPFRPPLPVLIIVCFFSFRRIWEPCL
ncbi:uncharacterized protein LOC133512830 isoform X4 [Syngnathoides biaculeatus]|uniref:uncharacterized protein LOC133512830 isoform X4 n=1 Tax=Syngnathoides biaculeatus TaxID=300417 RepID=UPI002ADDF8B0|nr:uncharacterized protein LOC133512830 isoform X4 [Syngnathoides biaculeatus]